MYYKVCLCCVSGNSRELYVFASAPEFLSRSKDAVRHQRHCTELLQENKNCPKNSGKACLTVAEQSYLDKGA